MDLDPGEGTSDGLFTRNRSTGNENGTNDLELTIKKEIKQEPAEDVALVEYSWETSTTELNNMIKSEGDSDCGVNDNGNDGVKIEVIPTTKPNGKRRQLNGKVNGRNRILTKKRNMANASKKSRANEQKVHKCQQCNYTTSFKSYLTQHIRTHTGERPFECEICAKSFARKRDLNRHKRSHLSQLAFHCSKCQIGFEEEIDKRNHEAKCRRRQYECHLCKYSTPHSTNLKNHMQFNHTGEKQFKCSVCSKRCTTKIDLVRHSQVHIKQLPFRCSKCGQRFIDEDTKQLHENRCKCRRFECYLCQYKSFVKFYLKQHVQSKHTGDKQFKCAICEKKFVHKGSLNKHSAVHAKRRTELC